MESRFLMKQLAVEGGHDCRGRVVFRSHGFGADMGRRF